jgi:hypothetical protein
MGRSQTTFEIRVNWGLWSVIFSVGTAMVLLRKEVRNKRHKIIYLINKSTFLFHRQEEDLKEGDNHTFDAVCREE